MLPPENTIPINVNPLVLGIYPTDMIIRSSIDEILDRLRAEPWLLDFCFQSILQDPIINNKYGAQRIQEAKQWFLSSDINTSMVYNLNDGKIPHLTIYLGNSSEAEATLADVHYNPSQPVYVSQLLAKNVVMALIPVAYDSATGIITLSTDQDTSSIWPGMRVMTKDNQHLEILEVLDLQRFQIAIPDSPPNLTNASLVRAEDLLIAQLESVFYKEVVHVELTVEGDATRAIVLYQLLLFGLHRYKQELFEKRGFERTVISANDMAATKFGASNPQRFFNRMITITGYVKQIWPKRIEPAIQAVAPEISFNGGDDPQGLDDAIGLQGWGTEP